MEILMLRYYPSYASILLGIDPYIALMYYNYIYIYIYIYSIIQYVVSMVVYNIYI